MYEKYGEDRFALACEIVARWLTFETKRQCSQEWVLTLCNMPTTMEKDDAEALRRLFGLGSTEELFSK